MSNPVFLFECNPGPDVVVWSVTGSNQVPNQKLVLPEGQRNLFVVQNDLGCTLPQSSSIVLAAASKDLPSVSYMAVAPEAIHESIDKFDPNGFQKFHRLIDVIPTMRSQLASNSQRCDVATPTSLARGSTHLHEEVGTSGDLPGAAGLVLRNLLVLLAP